MHEHQFLETADRIGRRLCRDAVWSGDRCNWLGWAMDMVGSGWSAVYKAQTPYLYDGTAGIGLFLARLYEFTRDPLEKLAAIGALNRAIKAFPEVPDGLQPSVYSGGAGIAYAALEIGEALEDERMIAWGTTALRQACSHPPAERWLDILGGSAGAIQVLLHVARRFDSPEFVELALMHAGMLLKAAVKSDAGWSWDTLPGQGEKHLLGYGHGAGGIGCALLDVWAETRDPEYREAAVQAFRFERSHFNPEQHNWPDLRSMAAYGVPPTQQVFATAWCHGAPGIGLSRLRALELLSDGPVPHELIVDLHEALRTTATACSQAFPAIGSLCLCHGLGGNAELLIAEADGSGRGDLRHIAENAGRDAMEQVQSSELPWPCGVSGAGETPNLMLGLAGIGHFYLRLYDSWRVPSILLLGQGIRARQRRPAAEPLAVSA
jgi:lantibiotic modifying enzyme